MNDDKAAPASRRAMLRAGVAAVTAGAAAGMARSALAQEKIAQSAVMYQDHPNKGQHCSICAQFIPPNACKVVQGPILPNGWCAAFTPKS